MSPSPDEDDDPPLERRMMVREKSRPLEIATALGVAGGLALLALRFGFHFSAGIFGIHFLLLAFLVRFLQHRRNIGARRVTRDVRIRRAGVEVAGQVPIPRAAVAHGYFQPRSGDSPRMVRLEDKRRRIVFEAEVTDEAPALEILKRLGLDAASKRAEFRGASPLHAMSRRNAWVVSITLFFVLVATLTRLVGTPGPPWMFLALVFPLGLFSAIPSKIVVGVDGIHVRWLWSKKFVPMSEIAEVIPWEERAIRITLRSGKTETIWTSADRKHDAAISMQAHRDAVYARITEAWRAHRASGPTADVAAVVARGTRPLADWRRALADLERREGGYRSAALRDEDLWRVVEDPRATEDARAGAAVLLRARLDDAGKARVRVAAEATASPRLRVALDAAASGDAEAALAALADLLPEGAEDDAVSDRRRAGSSGR